MIMFPWLQVIEERNQLQLELSELQSERDRLFEEKVQTALHLDHCTLMYIVYKLSVYVHIYMF